MSSRKSSLEIVEVSGVLDIEELYQLSETSQNVK